MGVRHTGSRRDHLAFSVGMGRNLWRCRGSGSDNTGDEAACERLTAERERIEARLPQHTADSRRERRRRVSQRAHVEGSAAMAAAAEEQLANERNRGRQRREK